MPLPETSDLPTVTQVTPAIVKLGNRYSVPYQQYLGKKKHGPGKYANCTIAQYLFLNEIVTKTKVLKSYDLRIYYKCTYKYICV